MTKIKRERIKYHAAPVKTPDVVSRNTDEEWPWPHDNEIKKEIFLSSELFQGITVSPEDLLKQKLPEFDTKSFVSSKPEYHLSKKEKIKQRHEAFLQKIDCIKQARKLEREKKNRKQTPIIGDVNPLVEALPSLKEMLDAPEKKQKEKERKRKSIQKASVRENEIKQNARLFSQVLKHPAFKEDADSTITEHLQNTLCPQVQKHMDTS